MKREQPTTPSFNPDEHADVPWLADLLPFPPDVALPLLHSPIPTDATGSYGIDAEKWIESEMGITLRYWQRWALRLQWAHRADGSLCFRTIIESTPRRSGKSVRLRTASVYRCAHPDVFGEQQLVLLAGKDTAIVLEHHKRTWRWAREHDWKLSRRTGSEEIEAPDGSRFVIRGKDSVYGYDVGYGIVDEAHGVHPSVVDDGIEPSLLDRTCPQLHLVSTSHRKATALMRRRINAAIANGYEDTTTLVMVWAAPADADISDPAVWAAANPYWSAERETFMTTKYEQALAGQSDPTDDDPDPIASYTSQYLNMGWWATGEAREDGEPLVSAEDWASLNGYDPSKAAPTVAAVETWFGAVAVVTAVQLDGGRIGVSSKSFPDLKSAAVYAHECGATTVIAGKSICHDELATATPKMIHTRAAMLELRQMLADGVLVHDSSDLLTEQVLALRVKSSAEGYRLVSQSPANTVKALSYAVGEARQVVEAPAVF